MTDHLKERVGVLLSNAPPDTILAMNASGAKMATPRHSPKPAIRSALHRSMPASLGLSKEESLPDSVPRFVTEKGNPRFPQGPGLDADGRSLNAAIQRQFS
jgi:hypothetical protein